MIPFIAYATFRSTGRWAFLGSVMYNYLYFGLLLILALTFGPEFFANLWIDAILLVAYLATYRMVGLVLDLTGIRRYGKHSQLY